LWESPLFAKDSSLLTSLKCFQWGNRNTIVPIQVVASNIVKWGEEHKAWLQCHKNGASAKEDIVHKHGIKRHNIMLKLPYWEISSLNQNIEFQFLISWFLEFFKNQLHIYA